MLSPMVPRALVFAAVLLAASCGGPDAGRAPVELGGGLTLPPHVATTGPLEGRLESTHRIDDRETWSQLAARPRNQTVARTEVVKFLIDLADARRLWLIDTERWDVHYFFARDRLSRPGHPVGATWQDHGAFNVEQYRRPTRRFVMGSLVHYLDPDLYTFEMVAGDTLDAPRVREAFEQVRAAVFFGERLRYRPISPLHEARLRELGASLPSVSADEVFRGVRYQPLTQGVSYGTLRFVRGPLDPSTVRPDQILVLEQLPDGVPVSSGVISQPLQAPLGHLAILCATRSTPNMGLRDALSDPRLTALEGRLVRLEVGPQDLAIRVAEQAEAEASWAARRPATVQVPPLDARDRGLPDVCSLRVADASSVGAKAAQLGEACSLGGVIRTPGGFAIPMHAYVEHLARTGASTAIGGMLRDPAFRTDASARASALSQLRAIVQRSRVDAALLAAVRRKIAAFPGEPRVILRSSTNAEDLAGFSGAGLYRSIVIAGDASEAQLADALREVWASTWLLGAYEEREWYRIDHAQVAMGVLVQPFVDGAMANGVAITRNPFYENRPGYYVNAQALGGSVTGAAGDEIPEQHLIYTYSEDLEIELLSRSSRTGGQPLLRETELRELAAVLRRLHEHFEPQWRARANSVDVEFLIAGPDRDVVVLQARPFRAVFHDAE
jgi:hypothetical protein